MNEPVAPAASAPAPAPAPAPESAPGPGAPGPVAVAPGGGERPSLRRRVYFLMATGLALPLALFAIVGARWLTALDDRLLAGRLSAVQMVAAHFDDELMDDLASLQRAAGEIGQAPDREGQRRALRTASEQFRHREGLFVLSITGEVLLEEPRGSFSATAGNGVVDEVLRSGHPRLTDVLRGETGPVVYELVPARDWRNQIVGLVGGAFRPDRRDLTHMLVRLRQGRTSVAELVDAAGVVVASTASARSGTTFPCPNVRAMIAAGEASTRRCDACHGERGVRARPAELMSIAPLHSAPWAVVLRQSTAEALPSAGGVPWRIVLAGLVAEVVLAAVFAWGAARSVTRPVAVLTEEAERIAGGALDRPIPELGEDEVGRLGKALDGMRAALRRLIEDIASANQRLEVRVAERTRALAEANAALRAREEVRRALLQKIITAQEDERKRIARELHDETSQSLAVLAMGLEAANDAIRAGKTPHLDEVKALAVRTLEDVHRLILDLRPSVLDDLGLFSAIRWYAERTLESRGVSVRCEFGELERRLPPALETVLFRITQECLTNIARHAQASAVLVQVGQEGMEMRIEIEDDGAGFDPAAAAARPGRRPWGLMGIRERAELFGGKVSFESAPGKGTRVEVRIPIPGEDEA